MKRPCVICGARVRNHNPKCATCDPICTAARHAGRTRTEQVRWELENPNIYDEQYAKLGPRQLDELGDDE